MVLIRETRKPETQGGQIWLVDYELRTEAIRISAQNDGFFAPGQEPLWGFEGVQKWIKCIYSPNPIGSEGGKASEKTSRDSPCKTGVWLARR